MKCWFVLFLFLPIAVFSQIVCTVLDDETQLPVSDVEIIFKEKSIGKTDSNGKFTLSERYTILILVHSEYVKKEFTPSQSHFNVYITPIKSNEVLQEVVWKQGESKSKKLIKEVIKKQYDNHPNRLNSYQFIGYNKFYMDVNADSIQRVENPKTKEDSAHNKEKSLFASSMGFLGERVIEYKYDQKFGEKKTIVANRVSGIKTPLYEMVAANPISLYLDKNNFDFFFRKFPNPVSELGLERYTYSIRDTFDYNNRPNIELSYRSKNKEDESTTLEGYIYIDVESKAVSKFFGERIRNTSQTYIEMEWEQKEQKWIPVTQYFKSTQNRGFEKKPTQKDEIKKGDKSKEKPKTEPKPKTTSKEEIAKLDSINNKRYTPIWIVYDTKFHQFESPKIFEKKEFSGYENEVKTDAFDNADFYLNKYRTDSLSLREKSTYTKIDSMGKAEGIDRKLKLFRMFTRGTYELGQINVKPFDLLQYNGHEGFRLQLGAETNYKFHERLGLNGYLAYGFKDAHWKGKLGISYLANKKNMGTLFASYTNDVKPSGRITSLSTFGLYSALNSFNNLYNENYYHYSRYQIGYQQDVFQKITTTLSVEYNEDAARFDYAFRNLPADFNYQSITTTVHLKYSPFAKYMYTPLGKVTIEDKYPHFQLSYQKTWDTNVQDFDFHRIEFQANYLLKSFIGYTTLQAKSGIVLGDAPLFYNFEGMGTARAGEGIGKRFTVSSYNAMETMLLNEFYSDKYVSYNLKHSFKRFKLFKNYVGTSLVYNGLLGSMENTGLHTLSTFKTPKKLFQEAGLELHNIINSLGIGVYYRMGAYHLPTLEDNLHVKMTFSFVF